jgi:hypothetical protein
MVARSSVYPSWIGWHLANERQVFLVPAGALVTVPCPESTNYR